MVLGKEGVHGPSIRVGGKRLWRNRNHLDATDMDEQRWRDRWDGARMFLSADGESGKHGGNETIRVDGHGQLRVQVPSAFVGELGSHLPIGAPLRFSHRGGEWWARVAARRAVRYDLSYDPGRGRWYLDGSWKTWPEPVPALEEWRTGRVLGVDLNDGHLGAGVLDGSGNPIGAPVSIEVGTAGLRASRRDGRVRAALTDLLDHAHQHHCSAVAVENPQLRRRARHRPGNPGPRTTRQAAAPPGSRSSRRQVLDPADRDGQPPRDRRDRDGPRPTPAAGVLNAGPSRLANRSPGTMARRPRSGDVASHWRSGGGRQDPAPDSGPLRSGHLPGPNISRAQRRRGSSGPPTRPPRGIPIHRKTPTARGQHRSGRTGLTPAH